MKNNKDRHSFITAAVSCYFFYFAQSLSRNIFTTLSPFLVTHYGKDLAGSSLFNMAESVGFVAVMLLAALISDRFSKGMLLAVLCSVYGITLLLMGSAPPFSAMIALLFLTGMLGRYTDTTCTAYVSDLFGEDRSRYMSWLLVTYYIGSTLAPNLNTLLLERMGLSWNWSYRVSGLLMSGGAAAYILFLSVWGVPDTRPDVPDEKERMYSLMDLIRNRNMSVLFFSYVMATVAGYFTKQLMLYLSMRDPAVYNTSVRGSIATAASLGMVAGSALYVIAAKKIPPHRYLALESLITSVFSMTGLIMDRPLLWIVTQFLCNAIGGGSFTARTLLCCEEFPERSSGAIALVSLASGISSIITTPLLNILAQSTSFSLSMCLSLFFGLGSWALLRFCYRPHNET